MGQTRVLAQVFGPHEVENRKLSSHEQCAIVVDFAPAPFSGLERKRRRPGDRQGVELALAVQQSLEATVLVASYPNTQIDVFLTVLQDDGGRLPCCLNAATLAVVEAGLGMVDLMAACSAGFLKGGIACADLSARETSSGAAHLPVAIHPGSEHIVLCQLDAKLPLEELDPVLALAISGCHQCHSVMRDAVQKHTELLFAQRELTSPHHLSRLSKKMSKSGDKRNSAGAAEDDEED
jgi:exosome complex component RRP41